MNGDPDPQTCLVIRTERNRMAIRAKARAIEERLKQLGGQDSKADLLEVLGKTHFSQALKHLRLSKKVEVKGKKVRLL